VTQICVIKLIGKRQNKSAQDGHEATPQPDPQNVYTAEGGAFFLTGKGEIPAQFAISLGV